METIYDWITVLIYAGLVTRFLSQAASDDGGDESILHYLVASVACAVANWLGNEGHDAAAIALIAATLAFIWKFIWPGRRSPPVS